MKNKTDFVTGLVTIFLGCIAAYSVGSFDEIGGNVNNISPVAFSRIIAALLIICGIALAVKGARTKPDRSYWGNPRVLLKIAMFALWFCVYIFLIIVMGAFFRETDIDIFQTNAGFLSASVIFLIGSFILLGRKRPLEIVLVSVCVPALIVFSFGTLFQIMLP